jgi:hypothetical protein
MRIPAGPPRRRATSGRRKGCQSSRLWENAGQGEESRYAPEPEPTKRPVPMDPPTAYTDKSTREQLRRKSGSDVMKKHRVSHSPRFGRGGERGKKASRSSEDDGSSSSSGAGYPVEPSRGPPPEGLRRYERRCERKEARKALGMSAREFRTEARLLAFATR